MPRTTRRTAAAAAAVVAAAAAAAAATAVDMDVDSGGEDGGDVNLPDDEDVSAREDSESASHLAYCIHYQCSSFY